MTKQAQWRRNEGARRHVKELLEKAGVPLELRAWLQSEQFRSRHQTDDRHIRTERILYGDSDAKPLREVDFCTTIYEEIEIADTMGIQLMLNAPVECKYRQDTEAFGFPRPQPLEPYPSLPIAASLAGSDLMMLLRNTVPSGLQPTILDVALLKIEGGKTPKSFDSEQIVYNAGASLYDFVTSGMDNEEAPRPTAKHHPIIEELLQQFWAYLRENHFVWWSVLHRWMRDNITEEKGRAYFEARMGERRPVYSMVTAHLPIVCLEGPLYTVTVSRTGKPSRFKSAKYLVTGLRVPNWPQAGRGQVINISPEVGVVVTDVQGLSSVYELANEWFDALRTALQNGRSEVKERAWLEAEFCGVVRSHFAEDPSYRSDHDIEAYL